MRIRRWAGAQRASVGFLVAPLLIGTVTTVAAAPRQPAVLQLAAGEPDALTRVDMHDERVLTQQQVDGGWMAVIYASLAQCRRADNSRRHVHAAALHADYHAAVA